MTRAAMTQGPRGARQTGMALIESLVAVLIFSIGLLALVGMLTVSVASSGQAQYRIEATNHAQSLIHAIRTLVPRQGDGQVNPPAFAAMAATLAHQPGGAICNFSGAAATHPDVVQWVARVQAASSGLPGALAIYQQIAINPAANNQIQVTLCWAQPSDGSVSRHEVVGYLQ